MIETQLVETWLIHHRINLYLLDSLSEESFNDKAASKGRSVGEVFAHLHNVRLMWLQEAAPELKEGLQKIEKEQAKDKELLKNELNKSADAIAQLLEKALKDKKLKGFKPHPVAF